MRRSKAYDLPGCVTYAVMAGICLALAGPADGTQLPDSGPLFDLFEVLGVMVLVLGAVMLAWGAITYEKPDYSRPEDRDHKKY